MALPVLTFTQFLTNILTAMANGTPEITSLQAGSTALAFGQSMAAADISLQQLMVHIANITRLATSYGNDVDTFVADYGLTRLPATPTTGTLFMTRGATGSQLYIPVGGVCQTLTSQIQFQLIADPSQPNYDVTSNSYIFGPSDQTINGTVQQLTVSTSGVNTLSAGTLTQIVSGFAGLISIGNLLPFTNGSPEESDAQLKLRFIEFIGSLAQATETAIEYAINTVQTGLTFQLIEQFTFTGEPWPGAFTVVVDDGSGNIPSTTLTNIFNAILPIRAAGISFAVLPPTNETINMNVAVVASASFSQSAVEAQVQNNLAAFVNTLGVGVNCGYVAAGTVVQATPGVIEYSGLTVNGGTTDIVITNTELARAGSITVS